MTLWPFLLHQCQDKDHDTWTYLDNLGHKLCTRHETSVVVDAMAARVCVAICIVSSLVSDAGDFGLSESESEHEVTGCFDFGCPDVLGEIVPL